MPNHYPWWKYLLLIVITVFGILYALPNIYGDEPAVQISGSARHQITAATITKIKQTLAEQKIAYKSLKQEKDNLILVRFPDTDAQMHAKDFIKAGLGDNYTVALNLAPATPKWLTAIGASPMKLGLDLRGGVHFLLAVDADAVVEKRIAAEQKNMAQSLRQARIRYNGIRNNAHGVVEMRFREEAVMLKALDHLKAQFRDYQFIQEGSKGRYRLLAKLDPKALQQMRQTVVEQTMTVLRNRVNELGVAEPIIQQQGQDRISVDLPGIQDAAQAKQILGGTATLEFHLVDQEHNLQAALAGSVPIGSRVYRMAEDQGGAPILLKTAIVLKGSSITSASPAFGQDGRPSVSITASGAEVSYFHRATADNVGKRMAIVYVETKNESKLVNGRLQNVARRVERVISAPVINSALGNSFQIEGLSDPHEANNLALLLRAGALPANIYPVAESTVGPSLGKENIHKGIVSVVVGFVLIVIFMAMYYRLFGLCANVALFMNLVITVAIMSLLGATLTLPGIAALVLTVGMSVDANVLINERIREELRNRVSPLAAIHIGYEKAFITIVDANVTTLIVAVVLFVLGTSAVQGFAVALIIGLLTSMFTAITGTRGLINLFYHPQKKVQHLSLGIKVKKA